MGNSRSRVFASGTQPKNISAGVYTSAAPVASAAAAMAGGWHVPGSAAQKRKRSDASGFHGGPMRLSVSGAVTQTAPRRSGASAALSDAARAPSARPQASLPGATSDASAEPVRATRSQRIMYVLVYEWVAGDELVRDDRHSRSLDARDPRCRMDAPSSSIRASGSSNAAPVLKKPKTKRVNMMQFMSSGARS